MRTSSLALIAILGVASITMLFIGEAPSGSDPRLPARNEQTPQATVHEVDSDTVEIRTPSPVGEVVFPHLEHIEDFEIECQECHHEITAAALNMPHEEYFEDFWIECGVCHHDEEEPERTAMPCSDCHGETPKGAADQTLSSKVAIHKSCWECHDVGTGAEASGECAFCHSGDKLPYALPASDK
jgi:hypothetical protein